MSWPVSTPADVCADPGAGDEGRTVDAAPTASPARSPTANPAPSNTMSSALSLERVLIAVRYGPLGVTLKQPDAAMAADNGGRAAPRATTAIEAAARFCNCPSARAPEGRGSAAILVTPRGHWSAVSASRLPSARAWSPTSAGPACILPTMPMPAAKHHSEHGIPVRRPPGARRSGRRDEPPLVWTPERRRGGFRLRRWSSHSAEAGTAADER